MGRFLGTTVKRLAQCRCLNGHVKEPGGTECLWRWEPDRRSNVFFSPPAHLCAVTYITEISLPLTLSNQPYSHSLTIVEDQVHDYASSQATAFESNTMACDDDDYVHRKIQFFVNFKSNISTCSYIQGYASK